MDTFAGDTARFDGSTPISPLLQQLYQLYTSERQLALDLSGRIHQTASLAERLDLSDRRKATSRHLLRLERVIQMTTGTPASQGVAGLTTLRLTAVPRGRGGMALEDQLRTLRRTTVAYGEAISTATRFGQPSIADLLAETLSEKDASISVLSSLWRGCP